MKMYHVARDYSMSLAQQKKVLREQYTNVQYMSSDGRKIHILAD